MSIRSKVRLGGDAWIAGDIDCDPVHLSTEDWEFLKLVIDRLREYEESKRLLKREPSAIGE